MHECVKKFLGNVANPEEVEVEALCTLLTTAGHLFDTVKARAHMDVYCSRMRELVKNPNTNSRMRSILQVSVNGDSMQGLSWAEIHTLGCIGAAWAWMGSP